MSIEFDDQMRAATAQTFAPGAIGSRGEREWIRDLECAGQETGVEDRVNRPDGSAQGAEADRETSAIRGQGKKFYGGFGNDAEQTFRAGKKSGEIKAGFIFVRAPADADDGA